MIGGASPGDVRWKGSGNFVAFRRGVIFRAGDPS